MICRRCLLLAACAAPAFVHIPYRGAVYGPTGLPAEIVNRVAAEFQRTLARPDMAERLAKLGAEPVADAGPARFAAMVKADSARWARLIRERKITAE